MSRILIIDDDQDILNILQPVLEDYNYEVFATTSAPDGLKTLSEQSIDIVVTDILMPDLDGIEVIQALKSEYPEVKIIAMSGGGSDRKKFQEYLPIAKRLGADEIIPKPIDLNLLLKTIQDLI